MTDTQTTDLAKTKAEATFRRKQEQAREGAKAMAEYIANQHAERAKTARLRALRLAKEAADEAADAAKAKGRRAASGRS